MLLASGAKEYERRELSRRAEPDPAWPARPTHPDHAEPSQKPESGVAFAKRRPGDRLAKLEH